MSMRKISCVAAREYRAIVGAKTFLIMICVMPVLMMGGMVMPKLLEGQVDTTDQTIVVLNAPPQVMDELKAAVERRNAQVVDRETGQQKAAKYFIEAGPTGDVTDELRLALSDRVRKRELAGFLEFPSDILEVDSKGSGSQITFYCENPALSEIRGWLKMTVSAIVQKYRLAQLGIDADKVRLAQAVGFEGHGLYKKTAEGAIQVPEREGRLAALFLPLGFMMFMFMVIMISVQPMLESVLEEKTMRIAEVLLGSLSPSQLMTGKLLGNVAGSLTVLAIYLTGGLVLAHHFDKLDLLPLRLVPWFVLFQVLAVLLFGAVFLAIGASVSQLKEAQGLLMPVWVVLVSPMFIWVNVVRAPMSSFATIASFIPPMTPMLMTVRMASTGMVPWWQPALGALLLAATTVVVIVIAGRIFRVGVLMQGKTPRLADLMRWGLSG